MSYCQFTLTSGLQTLRPCIKHPKNGLSYSYDDLLSVSNSSSGTYGFVRRPALKRSSSTINRKSIATSAASNTGYSTNSLCSNKSVKFKLPQNPSESGEKLTEKKFLNHMSYFFRGPVTGIPPGNYFMYQNYCNNCGMCPFSGNRPAVLAPASNFQLATWFQAQNFYQIQQDESGFYLIRIFFYYINKKIYCMFYLKQFCYSAVA